MLDIPIILCQNGIRYRKLNLLIAHCWYIKSASSHCITTTLQGCDNKHLYFPPKFDAVPAALSPSDGLLLASGHQGSYSTPKKCFSPHSDCFNGACKSGCSMMRGVISINLIYTTSTFSGWQENLNIYSNPLNSA